MFSILQKRHFYPGTLNVDSRWLVFDSESPYDQNTFETKSEAVDFMNELDNRTYYLSHGEYSAPDYKVVNENTRVYELAHKRTHG